MPETSTLRAVAACKCPHCHEGAIFKQSAFSLKFTDTYERCPVCDIRYEPEPGFFYGSMYIGYAFTVATLIISTIVLFNIFDNPPLYVYFAVIIGISLLNIPFNFRYSRVIYLYLFSEIKYDSDWRTKQKEHSPSQQ